MVDLCCINEAGKECLMKKTKVLIVAGAMDMGGLENQLMHLIRNADKTQFQIDYTNTTETPFYKDEIEALGGRCVYIRGTEGFHFFRYCRALKKIIKEGGYDVVHSHELFHSGLVMLTAKRSGVKGRIAHAHSSNQDYGHNYIRHFYDSVMRWLILHCGNMYLACSSVAAEFLYGKKIFDNPNYHLVVNSVDTQKFLAPLPGNIVNEFSKDGWKNVIQVGRFSVEKNYLFTCDIAKALMNSGEKIRILCVGNNGEEYEKQVRQKIDELGISDHMVLLGVRKDIDILMKKADAFILPSIYEGMPLTLIEAQSSGLPCVVSDNFSHEVDFGVGMVQWLKLEDGAEQWAKALSIAISAKRVDKELIETAINEKGFDSRSFAKKLCEYYQSFQ